MWTLQVPIQFWQHGVADIQLHTEVRAGSVLDYACDEPTLPPYLTLIVKGAGSSEVTADMNFFREYNKLFYENFIYIAATHTFSEYGHSFVLFWFGFSSFLVCKNSSKGWSALFCWCRNIERRPIGKKCLVSCGELVLDVDTKTQRVILKKKVLLWLIWTQTLKLWCEV